MLNQVQIYGLFLNLIIYIIIVSPIILVSFRKSIYESKEKFIHSLIYSNILGIGLSVIFHIFSEEIFSFFTNISGIVNYAVYASKIIFITSSLYSLKILLPSYLFIKHNKKTAILVLSKIAVNLILIFIGYSLFNTKGILYSFPICDFIYYIIYIKLFLNIVS